MRRLRRLSRRPRRLPQMCRPPVPLLRHRPQTPLPSIRRRRHPLRLRSAPNHGRSERRVLRLLPSSSPPRAASRLRRRHCPLAASRTPRRRRAAASVLSPRILGRPLQTRLRRRLRLPPAPPPLLSSTRFLSTSLTHSQVANLISPSSASPAALFGARGKHSRQRGRDGRAVRVGVALAHWAPSCRRAFGLA